MNNIMFEITEKDIIEYLANHKKDKVIKYREAVFVKYMREINEISKEVIEILMAKYNRDNSIYDSLARHNDDLGLIETSSLYTFNEYLSNIQNLDASGICHMMVPMLSYYNNSRCYSFYKELHHIMRTLNLKTNEDLMNIADITEENYYIAYGTDVYRYGNGINISFSKEKSKKMIQAYKPIYGEENILKIRKIVRERVK